MKEKVAVFTEKRECSDLFRRTGEKIRKWVSSDYVDPDPEYFTASL